MSRALSIVFALCLFTFTASAETSTLHFGETTETVNGHEVSKIDGKDPATFFKQFQYEVIKGGGINYHQVIAPGISYQSRINLGDKKFAQIKIAMMPDGTAEYEYSEQLATKPNESNGLIYKQGKTKWKVQGTKLIFEGLGEANGGVSVETDKDSGKVTRIPVMSFKFTKDIHSPKLTEGKLVMSRVGSTGDPKDWKDADYTK